MRARLKLEILMNPNTQSQAVLKSFPQRTMAVTMLVTALLVAACASPAERQALALASAPQPLPAASVAAPAALSADWWNAYRDAPLVDLIEEGLANNRDLARAMARIDESRASVQSARSVVFPDVSLGLSGGRQRASQTGPSPVGGIGKDFRASLNVAYEVDLWSRAGKLTTAARESLLATAYARESVQVALVAQVVQAYAALQALDVQRQVYGDAVAVQAESVALQRRRLAAGDLAELDLRQLEAELSANQAQLPKIDRARDEAERALALLLGRSPQAVVDHRIVRTAHPLAGRADVPAGLPSDLLLRRPDVQIAEAQLRAAGAQVDAARAAYFPRIALTAHVGQESAELSKLLDGPSLIWGVIASATQPIWNAGRLRADSEAAQARARQAELSYRDSVANAFKESHDALGAYREAQSTLELTGQRYRALTRAAHLTRLRFEGGINSRLDVINADRLALAARADLADAQRAVIAAQADVFRALGGGWKVNASTAAPEGFSQHGSMRPAGWRTG